MRWSRLVIVLFSLLFVWQPVASAQGMPLAQMYSNTVASCHGDGCAAEHNLQQSDSNTHDSSCSLLCSLATAAPLFPSLNSTVAPRSHSPLPCYANQPIIRPADIHYRPPITFTT